MNRDAFPREADRMLKPFARNDRPGFAVLVQRRGVTLFRRGFGLSDLASRKPITPDAMFAVASVSKQFTAAGTILLAQCGRIDLDDDVRRWIPEVPRYKDPIRVRHLLWHTSGLRSMEAFIPLAGLTFESGTRRRILEIVSRQRSLNQPTDTGFRYCNTGYFLLHLVIARASRIPFETFMREVVFRPAGMTRTVVRDRIPFRLSGLATGYLRTRDGAFHRVPAGGSSPLGAAGASEVISCVDDLGRWLELLRRRTVFSAGFHREMHRRGRLRNGKRIEYAGGLLYARDSRLSSIGHSGSMPGFATMTMREPRSGLSVVGIANCGNIPIGKIAYELAKLALHGKADTPPSPWDSGPQGGQPGLTPKAVAPAVRQLEGIYRNERANESWMLVPEGNGFRVRIGGYSFRMERAGALRFRGREAAADSEFFFDAAADGTPTALREYKHGALFKTLRAVAVCRNLDPALVRARLGRYRCQDFDITYTIAQAGRKIRLDYPLREHAGRLLDDPANRTFFPTDMRAREFACRNSKITFRCDRRGRTTGAVLSMPDSGVVSLSLTRQR